MNRENRSRSKGTLSNVRDSSINQRQGKQQDLSDVKQNQINVLSH
jgi:hypothetical protein